MTEADSVEQRFAHYLYGKAPAWALQQDPRFSSFSYIPRRLEGRATAVPLVVVVHGTLRQAERYRNAFVDFAEEHGCAVLAPLFPCGIVEPHDIDNYKRILYHDIRFDLVLLQMISELSARYQLTFSDLYLHGFSGGGQFAHRFLLLHPDALAAASIGAPGAVTLVDPERDWWVGTRDLRARFGVDLDLEALRRVPVLTVIGQDDSGHDEVFVPEGSRHWMPDANRAGDDRQERLVSLAENLSSLGVSVTSVSVPGAAHRGMAMLPDVMAFFAREMERREREGS